MALRDAFVSKAAAAALAVGLAYGGTAMAQEPASSEPAATTTTIAEPQAQSQVSAFSNYDLTFNPLLPYPALGGLAALALLVTAYGASQRMRGVTLRGLFAAAAIVTLANPEIIQEEREKLTTEVAVVIDRSPSQSLGVRSEETAAMQEQILAQLRQLPGVNVRIVEVGGANQGPVDGTQIFSALETALADVPPERIGGTFILTDGQIHDVPGAAPSQLGPAPIHVMVSGQDGERDRRVIIESAPLYGIVDENITVRFRVEDSGIAPGSGGPVRVDIRADGQVVETREVTAGQTVEVTMKVPHGGPNLIEVQAANLEGEMTAVNNRAVAPVEGMRDRLRVLVMSGQPAFGERTLRNLLKSDPAIDLIHFTILRPIEKQDATPQTDLSLIPVPVREIFETQLKDFDLIVLDRFEQQRGLVYDTYYTNIEKYVNGGGALLMLSGPDYAFQTSVYNTPLRPLMPSAPTGRVFESPFHPRVSDAGRHHPVTRGIGAMAEGQETPPWGRWFRLVDVQNVRGNVLMQGDANRPLLILNRQGDGRVAQLLSDNIGLWSRGFEGGGPHAELLQRTAHWLMKEYDLEEEALRLAANNGEITIERQTMADTSQPVTLIAPSGKTQTVTLEAAGPGLFRATVPATEMGMYRVEQADKFAFTNVGPANPKEFTDPRSTTEVLAPLVTQTGGFIGRMSDGNGVLNVPNLLARDAGTPMTGNDWAGVRMTEASTLKSANKYPLMVGLGGLFVVLGFLTWAWYRECEFSSEKKNNGGAKAPAPKI